ncbi:hypothetical protein NDU88_003167 [Pleurodeles waltl]|uniref:Uncharacterized protein n=1 Tax=Pleurodeles waltl TaxID=8319 RepID=A0AAV7NIK7_PLEWA|nr:hypothetical protein NDU88_003167 [Pleurodeles waltl]
MAAPAGRINPLPASLEEGPLVEEKEMAACKDIYEDIIVISDEEQERCDGFSLGEFDVDLQSVGQFDGGLGRLGEHVECVDQDGVIFRGRVCGQTSGGCYKDMFRVLQDVWQPGVEDDGAGCDAPRFPGGLSEVTVHREAGRPPGGQSLPVKVRAPLVHRKEGRVKSGAVYPTARESVMPVLPGHGAGSFSEELPSTSWGLGEGVKIKMKNGCILKRRLKNELFPHLLLWSRK